MHEIRVNIQCSDYGISFFASSARGFFTTVGEKEKKGRVKENGMGEMTEYQIPTHLLLRSKFIMKNQLLSLKQKYKELAYPSKHRPKLHYQEGAREDVKKKKKTL